MWRFDSLTPQKNLSTFWSFFFHCFRAVWLFSTTVNCHFSTVRCAGLHNLSPVIWRLYFNKLTKLNILFFNCETIIRFLACCYWKWLAFFIAEVYPIYIKINENIGIFSLNCYLWMIFMSRKVNFISKLQWLYAKVIEHIPFNIVTVSRKTITYGIKSLEFQEPT